MDGTYLKGYMYLLKSACCKMIKALHNLPGRYISDEIAFISLFFETKENGVEHHDRYFNNRFNRLT